MYSRAVHTLSDKQLFPIIKLLREFLICQQHSKSSEQDLRIELFIHEESVLMQIILLGWSEGYTKIEKEESIGFYELSI